METVECPQEKGQDAAVYLLWKTAQEGPNSQMHMMNLRDIMLRHWTHWVCAAWPHLFQVLRRKKSGQEDGSGPGSPGTLAFADSPGAPAGTEGPVRELWRWPQLSHVAGLCCAPPHVNKVSTENRDAIKSSKCGAKSTSNSWEGPRLQVQVRNHFNWNNFCNDWIFGSLCH